MVFFNINEAKTHLSKLVDRAIKGEEIVVGKSNNPLIRFVPYIPSGTQRKGGQWKGLVRIHEDFDKPLPKEIEAAFRGERK